MEDDSLSRQAQFNSLKEKEKQQQSEPKDNFSGTLKAFPTGSQWWAPANWDIEPSEWDVLILSTCFKFLLYPS
jgi:hypothetical protein